MTRKQQPNSSAVKGVLLLLLVQLLLALSPYLIGQFSFMKADMPPSLYYIVTVVQQLLLFFVPAVLFFSPRKEENRPLYTSIWSFPLWKMVFQTALCAVTGFFFFYHLSAFWLLFLEWIGFIPLEGAVPLPKTNIEMILALLAVGVAPAFFEEFLFRGVLLNSFKKEVPLKLAVVLVSLCFALLHQSFSGLPTHLALGFLLTVFAAKTGKIAYGILYHLFHNVTSLLFSTFVTRWMESMPEEVFAAVLQTSDTSVSSGSMVLTLIPTALITGFVFIYLLRKLFRAFDNQEDIFLTGSDDVFVQRRGKPSLLFTVLICISLLIMIFSYVIQLF